MSGRLQGKVCIVTGGASGFGKGIATKFVSEGAKVIIADLSGDTGKEVAQELGCEFAICDVTQREQWQGLLDKAISVHGQLDVIVNNAGATYANKPTTDVTERDYGLCMDVNVKSLYYSTNVLLPYFLENSRPGCFIQIASTAGIRPRGGLTWYNASKAAVSIATKSMAVEFGPKNIRFNAVCPVVGSTGMYVDFTASPYCRALRLIEHAQDASLPRKTRYRGESCWICLDYSPWSWINSI
jgi:NAD(P)-dependent dehydrogenase (short-subunit alcohol dehydrogenase family)